MTTILVTAGIYGGVSYLANQPQYMMRWKEQDKMMQTIQDMFQLVHYAGFTPRVNFEYDCNKI